MSTHPYRIYQDSTWDAKNEIWEAIDRADKEELKSIYNRIINATESESKQEAALGSLRFEVFHE